MSLRVQRAIEGWTRALLWQRSVDRALRPLGLTYTQLVVLHVTAQILGSGRAGVSKIEVAEVAKLDRSVTSVLLYKLQDRGYVDCGPHGLDLRKFSIVMTREGMRCLEVASAIVEVVARDLEEAPHARR